MENLVSADTYRLGFPRITARPFDHAAKAFFNELVLTGKADPFLKSEKIPADNGGVCCAELLCCVSLRRRG